MTGNRDLRFFVDSGVGRGVENWLRDNGYDVACVQDINPHLLDKEILRMAIPEGRMVITTDKDFGELACNLGLLRAGILLLRLEGESSLEKVHIIESILTRYADRLSGRFCVVQKGTLRIRN